MSIGASARIAAAIGHGKARARELELQLDTKGRERAAVKAAKLERQFLVDAEG